MNPVAVWWGAFFVSLAATLMQPPPAQPVKISYADRDAAPIPDRVKADRAEAVDGDTLRVEIDAWPKPFRKMLVRVRGIDAPETRSSNPAEREKAAESKAALASLLKGGVELSQIDGDKYFRLLADVKTGGVDAAKELLRRKLAVPYDGGKKPPFEADLQRAPVGANALVVHVQPGESLQAAADHLAAQGGGAIVLDPSVYEGVRLNMPWTEDLRYSRIRIFGRGAVLRSPATGEGAVIHIGDGWQAHGGPKLKGIEIDGLTVEQLSTDSPANKAIFIEATDGARIVRCRIVDSPFEGVYESGGLSNQNLVVEHSSAVGCGKKWAAGPLAAFNLNGYRSTLRFSTAEDCGWGIETGGTEFRCRHCTFIDSSVVCGSAVFGCSNQVFQHCNFERSWFGFGNGIGKIGGVELSASTFTDCGVGIGGCKETNTVQLDGLPFYDRPSVVSRCTMTLRGEGANAHAFRILQGDKNLKSPKVRIEGNSIDCPPASAFVLSGYFSNPIEIVGNECDQQSIGLVYPWLAEYHDPWSSFFWRNNRFPGGAYVEVESARRPVQ